MFQYIIGQQLKMPFDFVVIFVLFPCHWDTCLAFMLDSAFPPKLHNILL